MLRRICSTTADFERRASDLTKFLVYRGYREKFVRDQINRARALDRERRYLHQGQWPLRIEYFLWLRITQVYPI